MKSALKYATIPLPEKPRLAPWVTVIDLGDDRIQFRGAEFAFTLRHDLFIGAFEAVRPLLNGQHKLEEITASGGEIYLPTTISFLLKILRANGLLQEGNVPPPFPLNPEDLTEYEKQIQFFSHYLNNPVGALASLREARIALIGEEILLEAIQNALAGMGARPVTLDFESLESMFSSRLKKSDKASAGNLNYLIACERSPSFQFFEKINALCLEQQMRWIRVALEGTTAVMGPAIIPHQSACYVCYEGRIASNIQEQEEYLAFKEHLENNSPHPDEGFPLPLIDVVAGQTALEVVRQITGFAPPHTIGRFYEFKSISPAGVGHTVLRLPRCPACHSSQPRQEAWDQTIFLSKQAP